MLRERLIRKQAITATVDAALALLSLLAAHAVRHGALLVGDDAGQLTELGVAAAAAPLLLVGLLHGSGGYALRPRSRRRGLPRLALRAVVTVAVVLAALGFAFGWQSVDRVTLLLFAGFDLALFPLGRRLSGWLARARGARRRNPGRVVILGSGPRAREIAHRLEGLAHHGVELAGFVDEHLAWLEGANNGERYLGSLDSFAEIAARELIDEVVFALPRGFLGKEAVSNAIALCETIGIDFTIPTDLFDARVAGMTRHEALGVASLTLCARHHQSTWKLAVKRTIDVIGAGAGILATSPLWIAAAVAIKLDSPGPVFFVQQRCGLNGRRFRFRKFRTMYIDAEKRLAELQAQNELSGPVFKMRNDPRVTRVGSLLRRLSIDELPQLLNVLLGDMSLVGPRPPIPSEVERYELDHRRRLSMRPGLTCLWQVSGRNLIPFEDWVNLDLQYIDHWSLSLDFQILAATLPAVLSGQGAS